MPITSKTAHAIGSLGGRPKGQKNVATLKREIVKKNYDQKVLRVASELFSAQASIAIGQKFLYKITTNQKGVRSRPELITDHSTIEDYLAGDLNDDPNEYFFITTKEPDNQAIEGMLNRIFGKAKESLELTGEVKFSLKGLAQRRNKVIDATIVETKELPEPENPTV